MAKNSKQLATKGLQLKDILRQSSGRHTTFESEGNQSMNMDHCSLILERLSEDLNSFDIHSSSMLIDTKASRSSRTLKKSFNDQTEKDDMISSKSRLRPSRKLASKAAARNTNLLEDVFAKKTSHTESFSSNQDMPILKSEIEAKKMQGFRKQKSSKKILNISGNEMPKKLEINEKNVFSPKHNGFFKKSPANRQEGGSFSSKKEVNTLDSVRSSKVLPNTLLGVMKEIDSRKDKLNIDINRTSFNEGFSGSSSKKPHHLFSPKNLSDRKMSQKHENLDSVLVTTSKVNKTMVADLSLEIPDSLNKDSISSKPKMKKSRKPSTVSKQILMAAKEEISIELHYYMKDVADCFMNPTSKKAAKLRNIYLKHIHDNWNWYHKIKNLMPSVAEERKDLSYRRFDPDNLGSSKVLIKSKVADEGFKRKYMLLFDLDETLVHCDIKTQVKQGCAAGVSISESVNKVTFLKLD